MKKAFSLFLCVILLLSVFVFSASAENTKTDGTINIATIQAAVGDTVIVPVTITENPGIMAITINFTYDSSTLEYVSYSKGNIFSDYGVKAFPEENRIRFVNCESGDKKKDGTFLSFEFKVKDTAKMGLSEIGISYSKGDFCNYDLQKLMPTVIVGGVDVAFNGSNCVHKSYGEWSEVTPATCEQEGAEQRTCKTCGHTEQKKTEKLSHKYSNDWTVQTAATEDAVGYMVRYCEYCDSFTDKIEYSLQQSVDEGFPNTEGEPIEKNEHSDFIEDALEKVEKEKNKDRATAFDKIKEVIPGIDKILKILESIFVWLLAIFFI